MIMALLPVSVLFHGTLAAGDNALLWRAACAASSP